MSRQSSGMRHLTSEAKPTPMMLACGFSKSVTYVSDKSPEARSILWKNTVVDSDGYLRVNVDDQYPELIRKLLFVARAQIASQSAAQTVFDNNLIQLAELRESTNRTNVIFDLNGKFAMLTKWNFVKDGANICIQKDFLNQKLDGSKGTLSLGIGKTGLNALVLWKLQWLSIDRLTQFEFYIEDQLNSDNRPLNIPRYIIDLAFKTAVKSTSDVCAISNLSAPSSFVNHCSEYINFLRLNN